MKVTYDPSANVAYIRLRERQGDVEPIELTSDFLADACEQFSPWLWGQTDDLEL